MTNFTNADYLKNKQYADGSNLNARIQLHERFGQRKQDWHRWVFEQIQAPEKSKLLELGCGPGWLWIKNLDRIPPDWDITLSDLSAGMIAEAKQNIMARESQHPFHYEVVDVQAIPFADQSLDVVIANHMLYHVPDRDKALAEIRRVLKPGGTFYAATNGLGHLHELNLLTGPFATPEDSLRTNDDVFALENGEAQIKRYFRDVEKRENQDFLAVTETEPLLAFILSTPFKEVITNDKLTTLRQQIDERIASEGAIRIARHTGLFLANGIK